MYKDLFSQDKFELFLNTLILLYTKTPLIDIGGVLYENSNTLNLGVITASEKS
jgi:hypothetical protein